jgi:glutaredoxin 2
MILYLYQHCAYCVRIQAVLNLFDVDYQEVFLAYDDIEAHTSKINQKSAPILEYEPKKYFSESSDMIEYILKLKQVSPLSKPILETLHQKETNIYKWMASTFTFRRYLTYPSWYYKDPPFPCFKEEKSREYFKEKKEEYCGMTFDEMLQEKSKYLEMLNHCLVKLCDLISDNDVITMDVISLFSHLYAYTIIEGVEWPKKVETFLLKNSKIFKVNLEIK